MPFFPGERPMTPAEMGDRYFVDNALSGLEEQTGLLTRQFHFSIVHTAANGGWDFVIARPNMARLAIPVGAANHREPNPDIWWIWDADVDESEGWTPQATFTPGGSIDHEDDEGFVAFDRRMASPDEDIIGEYDNDEDDGGDPGGPLPGWPGVRSRLEGGFADPPDGVAPEEPEAPRTGPVRATIDLDDQETAEKEGITPWEEHEQFGVLMTPNGFAVVYNGCPAVGIVRYNDKTSCSVSGSSSTHARGQAEKFLAKRPYKTAMERVLEEPEFDAPEPPTAPMADETPTSPAVPRPKPEKRVWGTVPITSAEDDD